MGIGGDGPDVIELGGITDLIALEDIVALGGVPDIVALEDIPDVVGVPDVVALGGISLQDTPATFTCI